MADLMLLGLFNNVEITAEVVTKVRALGVDDRDVEVMSNVPFPEKFFGRKTTRLWFLPFVLGGALTGALLATFLTFGTPEIYPIHVGGQELTPVSPTAIIYFELIALFTMLGTFIGFLLQNRFPILTRQMYDESITDGYIGVQVHAADDVADKVKSIFEAHHPHKLVMEDAANFKPQGIRHLFFWGGVASAGAVALVVPLLISFNVVDLPWINTMKDTVAVQHQEGPRLAAPAEAIPIQGPVLIAGQPASMPQAATDVSLQRGKMLFEINCAICHGVDAEKTGATMSPRYFQEAPSMYSDYVQSLSQEDIFLTITNGKNRMPSLAENLNPGETWDIVNYIQSLSASAE